MVSGCDLIFDIPHPTDATLIEDFPSKEPDLNKILQMSNQDAKVIRIAYDFTRLENNWGWPRPESELGFSRQRWDEYRALFRKLDLPVGIERADQKDGVFVYFPVSTRGLGNGNGSGKGYAYLERELSPLLDSLDDESVRQFYERERPKNSVTLYRKLKGNWYLYRG
jgi:hypothetical protein